MFSSIRIIKGIEQLSSNLARNDFDVCDYADREQHMRVVATFIRELVSISNSANNAIRLLAESGFGNDLSD